MARIVVLQHLERRFLGNAEAPLRAAGAELDERDLLRGEPLPEPGEADAIIALGGDQSVRDLERYPYLVADVEWLREAGVEEAAARAADRLHLPGQTATADRIFGGFARIAAAVRR